MCTTLRGGLPIRRSPLHVDKPNLEDKNASPNAHSCTPIAAKVRNGVETTTHTNDLSASTVGEFVRLARLAANCVNTYSSDTSNAMHSAQCEQLLDLILELHAGYTSASNNQQSSLTCRTEL